VRNTEPELSGESSVCAEHRKRCIIPDMEFNYPERSCLCNPCVFTTAMIIVTDTASEVGVVKGFAMETRRENEESNSDLVVSNSRNGKQ
jgi:hypothetical protein